MGSGHDARPLPDLQVEALRRVTVRPLDDGKIPHYLTIQAPGASKAHTPVLNGG